MYQLFHKMDYLHWKIKKAVLTLTLGSVRLVQAAISSLVAMSGYLFLWNVASSSCSCCDVKCVRCLRVRPPSFPPPFPPSPPPPSFPFPPGELPSFPSSSDPLSSWPPRLLPRVDSGLVCDESVIYCNILLIFLTFSVIWQLSDCKLLTFSYFELENSSN